MRLQPGVPRCCPLRQNRTALSARETLGAVPRIAGKGPLPHSLTGTAVRHETKSEGARG